jgi:hypothetical protein
MRQIVDAAEGMWKVLYATDAETGVRAGELYCTSIARFAFRDFVDCLCPSHTARRT